MKLSDLADPERYERVRQALMTVEEQKREQQQAKEEEALRQIGDSPLAAPRFTSR